MRPRHALLLPLLIGLIALTACTSSPPSRDTSPSSPATGPTSTPTPTTPSAQPVPSPSETAYNDPANPDRPTPVTDGTGTGAGCSSPTSAIPAGAATTRIPDIDGDGKVDTEFLTTTPPFRYGIRTAAGGLYTFDDPLPKHGLHSAWTTDTDSGFGRVAALDDGHTTVLLTFDFNNCTLTPIRTTDGSDFTLPLSSTPDRSTGVTCTNQNGGTLIAAQETRRRPNGNYDLYQALIQPAQGTNPSAEPGQAGLDDFAPPARYTDLSPTDPRITQASGSYCWTSPQRVQIDFTERSPHPAAQTDPLPEGPRLDLSSARRPLASS